MIPVIISEQYKGKGIYKTSDVKIYYFYFLLAAHQVNLIHRAMAHWENYTCIRFVEWTGEDEHGDRLIIYPGQG